MKSPTDFIIKTAKDTFHYHGRPAAGQILRSLCPVIFTAQGNRAENVLEISSLDRAMMVPPMQAKLVSYGRGSQKGVGEIAPIRLDGTFDTKPLKFFFPLHTEVPAPGSRVLFHTAITDSRRKDRNGRTAASQRYVDVTDIKLDELSLRMEDTNVLHPDLYELLANTLGIHADIGCGPSSDAATSFTSLHAAQGKHTRVEDIVSDISRGLTDAATPTRPSLPPSPPGLLGPFPASRPCKSSPPANFATHPTKAHL